MANTNAGGKLYICATAQQSDLTQTEFEALSWVLISAMGNHGEAGKNQNILSYNTWDTAVIQKAKGLTDAGSPEIEVARIASDPGQIILRTAAATNLNYAFKLVRNDPAVEGGTGTIIYNRGLVVGPKRPLGRNEDFDLEVFTLGLNQVETVVDPLAGGNPPVNTVLPAITGTAQVTETLSLSNGTWTGDATITYQYQWFAGGSAIAGATSAMFDLTSAQLGKIIQARVYASNASGAGMAFSDATSAVIA
jgi:hypothetical protein